MGFGKSFTTEIHAATPTLAQPVQKLAAPIQKFSTLESQIKNIKRLGTLASQIKDFQNDLSKLRDLTKRHDLTKPLGVSSFSSEPLNKASLATQNLKDYEDRFNLMKTASDFQNLKTINKY